MRLSSCHARWEYFSPMLQYFLSFKCTWTIDLLLLSNFYPEFKKKTNYFIRFGHSLWSANQLLAQEVKIGVRGERHGLKSWLWTILVDGHKNSWFAATTTTTTTTATAATAAAAAATDATSVLAPTTRATTDDVIVAIPRNLGAAVNS